MRIRLRSSDIRVLALLCVGLQAVFVLSGISPVRGAEPGRRRTTILAAVFGPELLYRTPHRLFEVTG